MEDFNIDYLYAIDDIIDEISPDKDGETGVCYVSDCDLNALLFARWSVGKQVAEKVNWIDIAFPHCPNCNNDRLYTEDDKNMKYCSECGQKLDWSK